MSDEPQQRDFETLMRQTQAGDDEAARELHDVYGKYILFCVRHRMWRKLRSKFDSQDFVQQVWASFFHERENLPELKTPDDLIAYLQAMAERKVVQEGRRRQTQKHDVTIENRIFEDSDNVGFHPPTRLPTPSAVANVRDLYVQLVEQQRPDVRDIAELRAEGMSFEEIGEELDIDEATARKKMRQLRKRMPDPRDEQPE